MMISMNDTENTELKTGPESESGEPKEKLFTTREEFEAQAEDIFATMNQALNEGKPLREGYRIASEAYVQQEENPDLRQLADLILAAPAAARAHEQLATMRQQRSQRLDRQAFERLKNQVIGYNDSLRNFIFTNSSQVDRSTMTEWVEKGSNGNTEWTKQVMNGIAAEVAVARQIQRTEGVASIRFSTPEEERKGIDIVATFSDGETLSIDVKHRHEDSEYVPEYRDDKINFEISPDEINGFEVDAPYQKTISTNFLRLADRD